MGLQNSQQGPLNPAGSQGSTGLGVPNPSNISTPNPAANDAVDNNQLIEQFNVVQLHDCSGVIGDAINVGDTGVALLGTQDLLTLDSIVINHPDGDQGYALYIRDSDDGYSDALVYLEGAQINELHEGTSQLPATDEEQLVLAIAEGASCEEIGNLIRSTVGNLVTDEDLNAVYASLPMDSNCKMTGAALLDLTPLYEEILVRFQTNLMTDASVDEAYIAFIDASNALQAHIALYGYHPCLVTNGLHNFNQAVCDERRAIESELERSYQVYIDTTATVYEEMLALGYLSPYAVHQAALDERRELLIGILQATVFIALTEAAAAPFAILTNAIMRTALGRAISARITSTGIALSSMSTRAIATAAARIDRIRMLRYRQYPSIHNLDFATARRLESQLGPDRLRRLDNDISSNPELSIAIQNEPGLLDSWRLLDDLGANAAQRSDINFVRDTQTYSRLNISMVRNADGVIEPDLPPVVYERPSSDLPDLETHIRDVDINPNTGRYQVNSGSLGGGHNNDNFRTALENPHGLDPPVPGRIVSEVDIVDENGRVVGTELSYQIPRTNNRIVQRDAQGNIIYYPEKPKTVYDPNVISDAEMLNIAKTAGDRFYRDNYLDAFRNGRADGIQIIDGVKYKVFLKKTEDGRIVVDNVHITNET